ncbi:DUF6973 domain-containing protein [Cellulophaga omnivescoria]|uniref:DUF6973 domain-containing protein n=1 Tax=Cellulophaga omnivescoria TaxID=1888890 RepID=UPI0009872333|nr:hypothetical protein [Cellulophaga omnivescoria]WBU90871.1 hypothetical protein PBN93_07570 [Cellulophaga omnivescoria]
MKIWNRIKSLSIRQFFKLSLLFLRHPLLLVPSIKATKQTFAFCNTYYPDGHGKSNKGNAFRHAVWNALLCTYTLKRTKSKQKSVFWAQKVTDLYEKVTNNNELDELMDLQNNAVGRLYFFNYADKKESELINFILEKSKVAEKIANAKDIKLYPANMVYIVS